MPDPELSSQPVPPSSAPPPAPSPAPVTSQPAVPSSFSGQAAPPSVLDGLKSRGVDVSQWKSEDEFYGALQTREQQWQQMQQLAGHGQEYLRHAGDFQKWRAEQAKQAQEQQTQQAAAQKKAFEWGAPKLNRELLDMVRRDEETGRFVPKNQYVSPTVADEVNAYHDKRGALANRLVDEFPDVTWQAIEDKVNARFEELYSQRETQRSSKQTAEQFVQQYAQELYQHDQNGQQVFDPVTGEVALTQRGQMVAQYAADAKEAGITSSTKIIEYIRMRAQAQSWQEQQAAAYQAQLAAQQAAPLAAGQPLVAQQAEESRQKFLERAINSPNRSGSQQPALAGTGLQNGRLSFGQYGLEELARNGHSVKMD